MFAIASRARGLPAPRAGSLFFIAFLAYALASPPWARQWEGHPGNEPKTLRMAVAIGHGLTLDVEGVSGPMEDLTPRPVLAAAGDAVAAALRESLAMVRAAAGGPAEVGASAIRATRVTRQTVRGKDGGVYHVLAPGPSLLLAPALRIDRSLNLRSGRTGRLAVTLLVWNALAAALVVSVFLLVRDATGRPGRSAALAALFAFIPPFLFYFYQFYPEMLGALALALLLRSLLFGSRWTEASAGRVALLLAFLPWLHQKFLPVWALLAILAVVKVVDEITTFRTLLVLVVPQALSLLLFALYNFAITGSVRPDALFLAWGPGGVASAHLGEGMLGLLLDARYGIVPYAPIYLLALAGLLVPGRAASRLRLALPAIAVYYVTVAAADNWSGAVCALGRYFMPAAPFLAAAVGVGLEGIHGRRGPWTLGLALAAWTALVAVPLGHDPHAANDCALLLAKSAFADGDQYVPNLFFRSPGYGAPGQAARVLAWIAVAAVLAVWWRRQVRGGIGPAPSRVVAGVAILVIGVALVLERWPSSYASPRFANALELRPGVTVFVASGGDVEGDVVRGRGGDLEILLRARPDLESLDVLAAGDGVLYRPGRPPVRLVPAGSSLEVPLELAHTLVGRRGVRETLRRARVSLDGPATLRFAASGP